MKDNLLFHVNKILKAAQDYDKSDASLGTLAETIYGFLAATGYGPDYVVYEEDNGIISIRHKRPEEQSQPKEAVDQAPVAEEES